VTLPVSVVFGMFVHALTWLHSPVQGGTPHLFVMPPPPQIWPIEQLPQSAVTPPQPSATTPHCAPRSVHDFGVQFALPPPHVKSWPPPPHVSGAVHEPQSITAPQPSPTGPHVAFCEAHVCKPQPALPLPGASTPPPLSGAFPPPLLPQPTSRATAQQSRTVDRRVVFVIENPW
jgi:hypothetical protein